MNKQELIEQIDELKQRIEVLEKEVNSPEFEEIKKGVRQMPEMNKKYFYIDGSGCIVSEIWTNSSPDLFRFNTGNCFKTEQEAEDYKENLLTKQVLKDLALELNNEVEIDWNNDGQYKYYLAYSQKDNKFFLSCATTYQVLEQVYCLDETFLNIAKDRVGEEKLIKLIKFGL